MSLRKQMILYFSCVMIGIFILTELVNAVQSYRLLERNITASVTESLNLGLKNLDYYFRDAGNVCSSIMADERAQGILDQKVGENLDGRILVRELNKIITQYASTRAYITKVYLLDENHEVINPELKGEKVESFAEITENGSVLNILPLHQAGYIGGNTKVFSLVQVIHPYNDRQRRVGTIVADIDYHILEDVFRQYTLPMNGSAVLFDHAGNVILKKNENGIEWETGKEQYEDVWTAKNNQTVSLDESKYISISRESGITGWKIAALIPRTEFVRAVVHQLRMGIFLLGACLVIIVLVSRKIICTVYHPLNSLAASMKEIEEGNFETKIHYEKKDEFLPLIKGYNLMVAKIGTLLEEVVEKEKNRRNAELYALQAQINPHFLYNTLNSIRYFARVYHAPEIGEMTNALISLSKASLSSEKFITVEQELELTRQYLAIQKMRYGDILRFSCQLEKGMEACLIPRFSIQPLVENALFHGILPKGEGKAEVQICARSQGLLIKIQDDGIGMSEDEIRRANDRLQHGIFGEKGQGDISGLKNIGLENINYRIHIHYKGKGAGVYLKGKEEGLQVILWIPERILETEESWREEK